MTQGDEPSGVFKNQTFASGADRKQLKENYEWTCGQERHGAPEW